MSRRKFATGDRVRVVAGRWRGRCGLLVDWSWVESGQDRLYPVVRLDRTPRAASRQVRVVEGSLEREPEALSECIQRQDRGGRSGLPQVRPEENGGYGLVPCPEHPDTAAVDCVICEPVD